MSNSSNNSGNSTGGTITITGAGGGGGGGNGNVVFIPTTNPQWVTINIPQYIPQQIGIDFAIPVDEIEEKSEGCTCKKCKEFFEYAEPNQEDGTLICWACRHGY